MLYVGRTIGGFVVLASLPMATPPTRYVTKVTPTATTTVIALDDDDSVHAAWQDRFSRAGIEPSQVIHAKSGAELERVLQARGNQKRLMFLLDFDLGDKNGDGLTIASAVSTNGTKILVTSHYDNRDVRALSA